MNEAYLDQNYAGVLIIWSRIFGSFTVETEEPRYGILKPVESYNSLWINTHAWVEMFAAMRERKTLRGKLRCVFGSPNMDFIETSRIFGKRRIRRPYENKIYRPNLRRARMRRTGTGAECGHHAAKGNISPSEAEGRLTKRPLLSDIQR